MLELIIVPYIIHGLNTINKIFNKKIFSSSKPINWIIEEAHKRGIEFHALMNPFRINSNTKSIDEIIS